MKRTNQNILLLTLILGLSISFKQIDYSIVKNNNWNQTKIKPLKITRKYVFATNNSDSMSFGYTNVENDQAIGVRDITINGDFIYLIDPFHGNIKKLDIKTGEISCSDILTNNKYFGLRSICVFNQFLYVFSDKEDVFMLDLDLIEKKRFRIDKNWKGIKDVYSINSDTLVVYRSIDDVQQLNNGCMQISLTKISKENTIIKDTIFFNDYESYFATISEKIRGIKYKEIKENNKWYLLTPLSKFELPEQIPNTSKYYDSKNIDFKEDKIVYFDITDDMIILTVCWY